MKRTIWKFPLAVKDKQSVEMPKGAMVLTVQTQHGELCLWAEVDPSAQTSERVFEVFGTGLPMPVDMGVERAYVGTAQMAGGSLVWHVYERLS